MVHDEHDGPRARRHQQDGVDEADVVGRQDGRALHRDVLVAAHLEAVDAARGQQRDEAQQVFGHQQEDVAAHRCVEQAHDQEHLRDVEAGLDQAAGQHGAGDHEQRVEDVVRRDDARAVRGLGAQLDQRVHRHAVQPGAQRQQEQVGDHAPVRRLGQEPAQRVAGLPAPQPARGEVQVHREHRHADRADRHQADLHVAARQRLAQQRAHADADREHHQQHRGDLLVAVQHILRERGELRQEHRAEEPHPRDAQDGAEHRDVPAREHQVAPGLGERVPVDPQAGVGGRRRRHVLRRHPPQHRQAEAGPGHVLRARLRHRDQQAAGDVAEQDRDEGAHLDHAVAPGQLALVQVLRQVGVLDRAEQRRVQAHQEHAGQQQRDLLRDETPAGQRHDRDLQPLHEADQLRLVVLVGQLPAGGREQQEGQDEQRADHQPGERRRQPADLHLVGHQHREGELEQVVVARAEELGPEEGGEAALAEQRELAGMSGVRLCVHGACRCPAVNLRDRAGGAAGASVTAAPREGPAAVGPAPRWPARWVRQRTTCAGWPRPLRSSQPNTESTVTVSMRPAKRFSPGWSSNATLAEVRRPPRRVSAPRRSVVGR